MKFNLPNQIIECIETLENAGFEAFCVGGAVRDMLLGYTPGDFDVTTNATPEEVISLFEKTVPTGIKHGTITVIIENTNIEVTTYRTDGEYLDNRTPNNVTYQNNVENDLTRRDFTMNAILLHPKKGIFDPLNAILDINSKTIRAIGNPDKRFTEDALRIMRAFRFSAQLGFDIEEKTLNSALKLTHLLKNISVERIFVEFKKAVCSDYFENFKTLLTSGALEFLELKISEIPCFNAISKDNFALRFSELCHKNNLIPTNILKKLKCDSETIKNSEIYCRFFNQNFEPDNYQIKKMLQISSPKQVENFLLIKYPQQINVLKSIIFNREPYNISMLNINGSDLLKQGFRGEKIGEILEFLLNKVMKNPQLNNREIMINLIKNK